MDVTADGGPDGGGATPHAGGAAAAAVGDEVSRDEAPSETVVDRVLGVLTGPRRHVVLFVLLFVLFGSTTTWGTKVTNDARASSAMAWNLAKNGTLDLRAGGLDEMSWDVEGVDGELYTDRFPGGWLPAVPAYLVAPVDSQFDDRLDIPILPSSLTAAAIVAGALVVLHELLRGVFPRRRALAVTLVAGLGTTVWGVAADALWTHTVGVLVLALVMLALQRERYVLAGLGLGYAITVRPTHAFTALGIGVGLAIAHRSWRRLVQIGMPSLAGLGAMSLYSQALFGTWLPIAGYNPDRVGAILGTSGVLIGSYSWAEQFYGTFFDLYHGVLPYSPFLLLCVAFLVPGWRRAPVWAKVSMAAGILYWAAQLRGNRFTGGKNFFGYRFPIEPLWLGTVVYAHAFFAAMERRVGRILGIATVTIAVTVNSLGAAMFGSRYESSDRGVGLFQLNPPDEDEE